MEKLGSPAAERGRVNAPRTGIDHGLFSLYKPAIMITKIGLVLCATALLVPGGVLLLATEPAPQPRTGTILLLDNGSVLEGDIERVGDQFRIRRSIGETWMSADKVQCLCATVEEAYLHLRGQANLGDADERLRLARWCQQRGLRAQAMAEAAAAVELRPQHADTRRYLSGLQRLDANAPASLKRDEPEPDATTLPPVDFNSEALGMFVTRVQPVLMNACACCHASGRGGAFKLTRTHDGDLGSRRGTQQNLAAVLAQVNRDRLRESPLLSKAVMVHGGDADQPPLKGRQSPAYHILEEWVEWAMRTPGGGPIAAARPPAALESRPLTETPASKPAVTSPAPGSSAAPAAAPQAPVAQPATPPGPADEFDPMIFNVRMHGEK